MIRVVKPPHVAEAAVSMECELVHTYEVRRDDGGLSNTVVFGRVKRFHLVRLPSNFCGSKEAGLMC